MTRHYLDLVVTPTVAEQQRLAYGSPYAAGSSVGADALGAHEQEFIAARDSFYIASVSETGWPYVQHRGGPRGFLHVLDERTLAFADFRGNRQLLSAGNTATDPRVSLFLMDYPGRQRLKILGRAHFTDADAAPDLARRLAHPTYSAQIERVVRIDVEAWDRNCPQHIVPRFTTDEVDGVVAPLRARIRELELQLAGSPAPTA